MAASAIGWGMSSTLMVRSGNPFELCQNLIVYQATGFNFGGLVAARVSLGVFEAGFGPAIPLYFCKLVFFFTYPIIPT